ncbi:hypothetical protein ACUH97_07975 [Dermabacteraceae bacterium P13088]
MILFPDPVAELRAYLLGSGWFAGESIAMQPRPDDHVGLYVYLLDAGGPGIEDTVTMRARLTVECSHEDSAAASLASRRVDSLLRDWNTHWALWQAELSRSRFDPDPDMRCPAYTSTHVVRFLGEEVTPPPAA